MKKGKKSRIILSITALVETVALIVCATYSWVEGGQRGEIKGAELSVSTGSNLTMMYEGDVTNTITIPPCGLDETSSKDGRNFFFPLADNTTSNTSTMTFREGVAADRNNKYLSIDFELKASESGASVHLGSGTMVQCSNADVMNALRMSLSTNDGTAPKVFKVNQMPGVNNMKFSPIVSINESGAATTGSQTTEACADYYYNGDDSTEIFTLAAGETKHITYSLWLEGTEFSNVDVSNQDLKVYIEFTTSADNLKKYNFQDNTHGYDSPCKAEYWLTNKEVGNKYDTMIYLYDNDTKRYYAMSKSKTYTTDHTWSVYVPDTVENFTFRRYSIDIDQWWNEWSPTLSNIPKDPKGENTYVAICGNGAASGQELQYCAGYWKDSQGHYRIYFQNNRGWNSSTIYCYAWKSDKTAITNAYPGNKMTDSGFNSTDGKDLYYIEFKESDNVYGVIFNNNSGDQTSAGDNKTPDIVESSPTTEGFFFNGSTIWYNSATEYGHYIYYSHMQNKP